MAAIRTSGKLAIGTLALAAALVAALLLLRHGPAKPAAKGAPARPAAAPAAQSARRRFPEVPRWSAPSARAPDLDEQAAAARAALVRTLDLPSGLHAELAPRRARFPTGAPVELELRLSDASGAPVAGRRNVEIIVDEGTGGPWKAGFTEDPDEPGRYFALLEPRQAGANRLRATAIVSENGLVADPGKQGALDAAVEIGAPAALVGPPSGHWTEGGYRVTVRVGATVQAHATVRAILVDATGRPLGEAAADVEAAPGDTPAGLLFALPRPAEDAPLWLQDATLYSGDPPRWVDFWPQAARVQPEAVTPGGR